MKDWDLKINGEPFVFGRHGGVILGKVSGEASAPSQGSLAISNLNHGPGQIVTKDPAQYAWGDKVDTSQPGAILPTGKATMIYEYQNDSVFDGIHGSCWFQVGTNLFLVTPKQVFKVNPDTDGVTLPANGTAAAGTFHTGSCAHWGNEVLIGKEKAPATPIGGDTSNRYAEAAPLVYSISGDSFSVMSSPGPEDYFSRILSSRGTLWWIKNQGLYGAPELYWTDASPSIPFKDIPLVSVYGPFRIPMGGYATGLFMAGPSILVLKRDGSIIGTDESQIWVPYTPSRGVFNDDFFGQGAVQYLSVVFIPDKSGTLVFNPNTMTIQSGEPSILQGYSGHSHPNFIRRGRVFATRGVELYVFGETASGCAMYFGAKQPDDSLYYSSDFGHYSKNKVITSSNQPFTLRKGLGSVLRQTSGPRHTIRAPLVSFTEEELPVAAIVYHDETNNYWRLYVANMVKATNRVRIYRIDLPGPSWSTAPSSLSSSSTLVFSKQYMGGRRALPTAIRGYFDTTPIIPGGTPGKVVFSIGENEDNLVVVGEVNSSGHFTLPVPLVDLSPAKSLMVHLSGSGTSGWKIELPLFIDYESVPEVLSSSDDLVSISITVGDNLGNLRSYRLVNSPRGIRDYLLSLKGQQATITWPWELAPGSAFDAIWKIWVKDVRAEQIQPMRGDLRFEGEWKVIITGRRIQ